MPDDQRRPHVHRTSQVLQRCRTGVPRAVETSKSGWVRKAPSALSRGKIPPKKTQNYGPIQVGGEIGSVCVMNCDTSGPTQAHGPSPTLWLSSSRSRNSKPSGIYGQEAGCKTIVPVKENPSWEREEDVRVRSTGPVHGTFSWMVTTERSTRMGEFAMAMAIRDSPAFVFWTDPAAVRQEVW
ncbi:hypothetical protein ASPFODRAFT_398287 [Aspergillus luchuensis CBS 106.47]|uniref:Uncharacterized protein n=1 Tax=Aspergillus luchuensis (strain CBS 106.47) TaxID=1137211 RepID=A0A1M3T2L0_ASPLC|nr:hypothetical protein ASPFODRAFT_398287 [Aspergillus luchuensis CBS 106.47]